MQDGADEFGFGEEVGEVSKGYLEIGKGRGEEYEVWSWMQKDPDSVC